MVVVVWIARRGVDAEAIMHPEQVQKETAFENEWIEGCQKGSGSSLSRNTYFGVHPCWSIPAGDRNRHEFPGSLKLFNRPAGIVLIQSKVVGETPDGADAVS